MARLALVTRNPGMAMAVAATPHEVVEVRPYDLEGWLEARNDNGADALILDLGSPAEAMRIVGDLRAEFRWIPVLLVMSDDPEWAAAKSTAMPGVDLLELPLDAERLQRAVDAVLRLPRGPAHQTDEPVKSRSRSTESLLDPVPDVESGPVPDLLAVDPGSPTEPAPGPPPAPEPPPTPEPPAPVPSAEPAGVDDLASRTAVATPRGESGKSNLAARGSRLRPSSKSVDRDSPSLAERPAPITPQEGRSERISRPQKPAPDAPSAAVGRDVVDLLTGQADSFYTLAEVAGVIAEDAAIRSRSDASVLLVPDGDVWRVAGGIGLRPLEFRLQLTADSWVVEKIASAGKGVLIEHSDVARENLRGAPLASRPHLMAVPVPNVHAILLLARESDEAYTEQSLGTLAELASESGPMLERALAIRALARKLVRHVDPVEGTNG